MRRFFAEYRKPTAEKGRGLFETAEGRRVPQPPQWARNAGNPECNEGQKTIVAKPGEERYIREKGAGT